MYLKDFKWEHLKWADGKSVKAAIDVEIFDLLGPKTEDDLKPSPKSDKKKDNAKASDKGDNNKSLRKENNVENDEGAHTIGELTKTKVHFHAPGENYKTEGYMVTNNTENLPKQNLLVTGGRVQTRFPPEPNGILHIGYAKAININFGYAAAYGGICYLRYDDTNFENEEEKFFTGRMAALRFATASAGTSHCPNLHTATGAAAAMDDAATTAGTTTVIVAAAAAFAVEKTSTLIRDALIIEVSDDENEQGGIQLSLSQILVRQLESKMSGNDW
uniref:Glutamyl/glutaminyl-tRNA synthetase class Ib catalytic domain-containing protein n=1 Tax=Glossina austeni TaxID=7395 RepID=A0A1A9VDD8_GLOAU